MILFSYKLLVSGVWIQPKSKIEILNTIGDITFKKEILTMRKLLVLGFASIFLFNHAVSAQTSANGSIYTGGSFRDYQKSCQQP